MIIFEKNGVNNCMSEIKAEKQEETDEFVYLGRIFTKMGKCMETF